MRGVTGREQSVVRADARESAIVRPAVDRNVFPKHIAIADAQTGVAALEFQILRLSADARVRKNLAGRAEHGVALDRRVMVQLRARAERDPGADKAIRAH